MKSEISNDIEMDKASLKKLSKSELIKLLLKQEKKKPQIIVVDDTKKKQKVVYNLDNLFDNDPFPYFVITNDPFKVYSKKRNIDKQLIDIDSK